jgi:hypothetical protein
MNAGYLTIALDDLWRTLTAEQAAALRAAVPVALRDQIDAAAAETALLGHRVRQATENGPIGYAAGHLRDLPDWLRLGIAATYAQWWTGQADTCMHAPRPARPRPIVAAAWRPGMVTCVPCTPLLGLPRGSTKDRTCDACGRVVAGADHGDPMYPISIASGPLTYLAGTCGPCRPITD